MASSWLSAQAVARPKRTGIALGIIAAVVVDTLLGSLPGAERLSVVGRLPLDFLQAVFGFVVCFRFCATGRVKMLFLFALCLSVVHMLIYWAGGGPMYETSKTTWEVYFFKFAAFAIATFYEAVFYVFVGALTMFAIFCKRKMSRRSP